MFKLKPYSFVEIDDRQWLMFAFDDQHQVHKVKVLYPDAILKACVTNDGQVCSDDVSSDTFTALAARFPSATVNVAYGHKWFGYDPRRPQVLGATITCPRYLVPEMRKYCSGKNILLSWSKLTPLQTLNVQLSTTLENVPYTSPYNTVVLNGTKVGKCIRSDRSDGAFKLTSDHYCCNDADPNAKEQAINIEFSVLSWDIETHHMKTNVTDHGHQEHFVTQICAVFCDGSNDPRRFVLKWTDDVELKPFEHFWDDPVKPESWETHECETLIFKNELEMLKGFHRLVVETLDPDMMVAHNCFGFDWPYLQRRFNRYGLKLPNFGREDSIDYVVKARKMDTNARQYDITIFDFPGRLNICSWLVTKLLDTKAKVESASLSSVSAKFLNRFAGKTDMDYETLFEIHQKYFDLQRQIKSGQPIDMDEFNSNQEDLRKVERYCVIDSELVSRIMFTMGIPTMVETMSRIYGIEPKDAFVLGQSAKVKGLFYKLMHLCGRVINEDILMPQVERMFEDAPGKKLIVKGGHVFPIVPGVYHLVATLDFTSLYPKSGEGGNTGSDTCYEPEYLASLSPEELEELRRDSQCLDEIEWFKDCEKTWLNGFVSEDKVTSVMTHMFRIGFAQRTIYKRKRAQYDKDAPEYRRFDTTQLVFKELLNSIYGLFKTEYSVFRCIPAQARITSIGRRATLRIANIIKDWGFILIGGDTDSVFIRMEGVSYETLLERIKALCDHINAPGTLPVQLNIDVEKLGVMLFKGVKKDYTRWVCYDDEIKGGWARPDHTLPLDDEGLPDESWLTLKGILAKRDSASFSRRIVKRVNKLLLLGKSLQDILDYVRGEILQMREWPLDEFVAISRITSTAMDPESEMWTAKRYRNIVKYSDRKPQLGDSVKCVLANLDGGVGERTVPLDYMLKNPGKLSIDYRYYIQALEKKITKIVKGLCSKDIERMQFQAYVEHINSLYKNTKFPRHIQRELRDLDVVSRYKRMQTLLSSYKCNKFIDGTYFKTAHRKDLLPTFKFFEILKKEMGF